MGTGPKTRIALEETSTNVKLDSWKEIAAYLDRDPRTVQMWEKQEGFPVHRLAHRARSSVYAFTAEIDAWMRMRSNQESEPLADAPSNAAHPPNRTWLIRIAVTGAAALLCLGVSAVWISRGRRPATSPVSLPALAVLPFQNQTSTNDSLANNLTENVIGKMVQTGSIPVIASQSSMKLKDTHLSVQDAAAKLHASLLLRGTVAQVGDQLQATVELLRGPDFVHDWGATYRRKVAPGESTGDEIASAIALDLTRRLTGSAPQAAFAGQNIAPRARQDALTARFYWNQRDLANLRKAIALYRQALAIDPKYAAAEAGLAECYDLMTDRGVMSDQAAFARAKAAAQSAIALDANEGEAYSALAFAVYRQDWDFVRADRLFRKAIALDPNSAVAHQWYGEFLGDLRRFDDSIAELRKAQELDPLSPMVGADLADGYMHAGRDAEAERELERVLELYPDFPPAHLYRITLYLRDGNLARAEAAAQRYSQLSADSRPLEGIRVLELIAAGKKSKAEREEAQLLALSAGAGLNSYARARLLFSLGRADEGYAALEQAYREHSWWMVNMLVDPAFEPVRKQARFIELAHRVGLPLNANLPLMARGSRSG